MPIKRNIKILIADDESEIRETLRDCLELRGYDVIAVAHGEDVFEKVIVSKPDLIILDVVMPDKSGFEILKELKDSADTKDIPVFMLSVRDDKAKYKKGLLLGASEYIVKPFSLKSLYKLIWNSLATT